ncbi:MAG: AAA family ATPase [Bacteroides sp.]|nr:AAA family ATPase [Bacteroides sp.]
MFIQFTFHSITPPEAPFCNCAAILSPFVLTYRKRIKLPWTTPHSRTQFLSYYLSMDDLTSGFNIGTNYTLNPQFNEMTGFTEKDVRDMLEYYSTTCPFNHSVDELIELIAFLLRNADHQRNA